MAFCARVRWPNASRRSCVFFDDPKFYETLGLAEGEDWFVEGRLKPNASTREARIRVTADALLDNFEVAPERLSRLARISFTSPDRALSKRIVDAWGTNFIQSALERRFEGNDLRPPVP